MNIQRGGRAILIHGLGLVMAGLVWGIVVPNTPHPRLALTAHIQFVSNGMLFIVLAVLLLKLPHRVGPKSAAVMVGAAWVTWLVILSEAANAWWGASQMLPVAAGEAGAAGVAVAGGGDQVHAHRRRAGADRRVGIASRGVCPAGRITVGEAARFKRVEIERKRMAQPRCDWRSGAGVCFARHPRGWGRATPLASKSKGAAAKSSPIAQNVRIIPKTSTR